MTDLKTLVEAIERYTSKQYVPDAFGRIDGSHSERNRDRNTIADSFCCQDAIKDTVVESLGFVQKPDVPYWVLSTDAAMLTWSGISGSIYTHNRRTRMVNPQPKTRGDLLHLLWRLTRPETTK